MKIKLSKESMDYLLKQDKWDRNGSHNFVPSGVIQDNIQKHVKEILNAQKRLTTNRDYSIFAINSCIGAIDSLYENVCRLPNHNIVQKMATVSDTLTVIADDLCTRITLCSKYLGNVDFEPTNSETIAILEKMYRTDEVSSTYEQNLINSFGVTSDIDPVIFKMDKMQHICSALNDITFELLYSKEKTELFTISSYFADIIYDIQCLIPTLFKDDCDDIFSIFVEDVESVIGISIATIDYYNEVNGASINADKLEFNTLRLFKFFRDEILDRRCNGVFQDGEVSTYDTYVSIYDEILHTMGIELANHTECYNAFNDLLFSTSYHMLAEALNVIWNYFIETKGDTDCFSYTICSKISLIVLFMITNNHQYLNMINMLEGGEKI